MKKTTTKRFVAYRFTANGQRWYRDSNTPLKIKVNRKPANDTSMKHFERVLIDDVEVDPENYELLSGSVIVKFAPEYLRTLELGNHDLLMEFDDGSVGTTFTITNVKPQNDSYKLPKIGID